MCVCVKLHRPEADLLVNTERMPLLEHVSSHAELCQARVARRQHADMDGSDAGCCVLERLLLPRGLVEVFFVLRIPEGAFAPEQSQPECVCRFLSWRPLVGSALRATCKTHARLYCHHLVPNLNSWLRILFHQRTWKCTHSFASDFVLLERPFVIGLDFPLRHGVAGASLKPWI